jgi:hypothetical protein
MSYTTNKRQYFTYNLVKIWKVLSSGARYRVDWYVGTELSEEPSAYVLYLEDAGRMFITNVKRKS